MLQKAGFDIATGLKMCKFEWISPPRDLRLVKAEKEDAALPFTFEKKFLQVW